MTYATYIQRWAKLPPFGDLEGQDQIIKKCDHEDQRSDRPNTLIVKIKIVPMSAGTNTTTSTCFFCSSS